MKTVLVILLLFASPVCHAQQEIKFQPYFTAIMVSNIDQSVQWYSDMFGLKVRSRYNAKDGAYRQVMMHSSEMLIELVELKAKVTLEEAVKDQPKGTGVIGFTKFGFAVAQFDELHQVLTDKKANFAGRTIRDGASGKRTFSILDPDNNMLQFFEP